MEAQFSEPKDQSFRVLLNPDQADARPGVTSGKAFGKLLSKANADSRSHVVRLITGIKNKDQRASNALIRLCMPLLNKLADQSLNKAGGKSPRCEKHDLIQAGSIGIFEAINSYDPNRGSFATYATPFIRRAMQLELSKQEYPVHVADHPQRDARKLYTVRSQLTKSLLREPTSAELAEAMGVSEPRIAHLVQIESYRFAASLNARIHDDEDTTLEESIPDRHWHGGKNFRVSDADDIEEIKSVASTLPQRERNILFWHFGLDGEEVTNRDIAIRLQVSEQRVGQILKKVVPKIRALLGISVSDDRSV